LKFLDLRQNPFTGVPVTVPVSTVQISDPEWIRVVRAVCENPANAPSMSTRTLFGFPAKLFPFQAFFTFPEFLAFPVILLLNPRSNLASFLGNFKYDLDRHNKSVTELLTAVKLMLQLPCLTYSGDFQIGSLGRLVSTPLTLTYK
jgi:hypothetical protein